VGNLYIIEDKSLDRKKDVVEEWVQVGWQFGGGGSATAVYGSGEAGEGSGVQGVREGSHAGAVLPGTYSRIHYYNHCHHCGRHHGGHHLCHHSGRKCQTRTHLQYFEQ